MPDNKHYLTRVAPEHKQPKFMQWLEVNLDPFKDAEALLNEIGDAFDLDKAVGKQLDVIGDIVGRKRLLSFDPADGSSPLLDDRIYRILQKAKISINQWDGTIPSVLELWANLFPEYELIIQDNLDMSISLYVVGLVTPLEKELMGHGYIAPKPQGVKINYTFITEYPESEPYIIHAGGNAWPCISTTHLPPYKPTIMHETGLCAGVAGAVISLTALPPVTS